MILAVDVHYKGNCAAIGGVTFAKWSSAGEESTYLSRMTGIKDYMPGAFFRRELPCILHLLSEHSLTPDTIVVDGFVFLDGLTTPGLGKHLFDALGHRVPVVGVAKSRFAAAPEDIKLYRGRSKTPLYVTSVGIPSVEARQCILSMHGRYRIPFMLKMADQVSRMIAPTSGGSLALCCSQN